MFVSHVSDIESSVVEMEGVQGAAKQVLIGPDQGWEGHVMRHFTLESSGHTPKHSHPWPHINYITEGKGTLLLDGKVHKLTRGSVAYVPAGTEHQFSNPSRETFSFICIVPNAGEGLK